MSRSAPPIDAAVARLPSGARMQAVLTAFTLCLVAGTTALTVFLVTRVFDRVDPWTERDLIWKATHGAVVIARSSELGILTEDAGAIQDALGDYIHDEDVAAVLVAASDGRVLFRRGGIGAPDEALFVGPQRSLQRSPGYLSAWESAEIEGQSIGKVAVAISTARLDEGARLRGRILWIAAAGCAIALLVSVGFVSLYIGPLLRLAERMVHPLRELNASLEQRVRLRTLALATSNRYLATNLHELRETQQRLVDTSRAAGMAEVASSVLHNVGNVLNSVNVTAHVLAERLLLSPRGRLAELCALLRRQGDDLPRFMAEDPRGRAVLDYLEAVATSQAAERSEAARELATMQDNIEHIKAIISTQQSLARSSNLVEEFAFPRLMDSAVDASLLGTEGHAVEVERDYGTVPRMLGDRHKIFHILLNLLRNAQHALADTKPPRRITIRARADEHNAAIEVADNGCGISSEHLPQIFTNGFTTRPDGHGFGLHASALAAAEMGGTITVRSDGPGAGAVFTVEVPLQPPPS